MDKSRLSAKPGRSKNRLGNQHDRIFKEDYLPVIVRKLIGLDFAQTQVLKDKIQVTPTLEGEGDDFRLVPNDDPAKVHGLQVEVHGKDEDLRRRNQLHCAMFYHKHSIPLRQIVVYVGNKKTPEFIAQNRIEGYGRNLYEFEVYDIRTIPASELLASNLPVEVVLAILADFGGKKPVEVIREILRRLLDLTGKKTLFRKYSRQLHVLSKLRNLQPETKIEIEAMPTQLFTYQDDLFYQKGEQVGKLEGILEGILEGKLEGMTEKTLDVIINLILYSDHADDFIARIAGAENKEVAAIRAIMAANPDDYREKARALHLDLSGRTNGAPG